MAIRRSGTVLSLILALLAVAPAGAQDTAPRLDGTGVLLGTVVADDTGAPLPGTDVAVLWAVAGSGSASCRRATTSSG